VYYLIESHVGLGSEHPINSPRAIQKYYATTLEFAAGKREKKEREREREGGGERERENTRKRENERERERAPSTPPAPYNIKSPPRSSLQAVKIE